MFKYDGDLPCVEMHEGIDHCESQFIDKNGNKIIIYVVTGLDHNILGPVVFSDLCYLSKDSTINEDIFCE